MSVVGEHMLASCLGHSVEAVLVFQGEARYPRKLAWLGSMKEAVLNVN